MDCLRFRKLKCKSYDIKMYSYIDTHKKKSSLVAVKEYVADAHCHTHVYHNIFNVI